jgi:pilus assembly protein CpaC
VTARETETGVSLSGSVPTPMDADKAALASKGVLPPEGKVDNELKVTEPTQVSLHVRIAEMNRTLTRDLGINWSGSAELGKLGGQSVRSGTSVQNPGFGTNTQIVNPNSLLPSTAALQLFNNGVQTLETTLQALAEDQLIHILAEPNLTTMSGEPANFLAGGEFPIPVSTSSNTVSLEFKQYGISLAFVPTVIAHDQIILHVRPEVSQLDKANGVTFLLGANGGNTTGVSIPALTVRRADTTVQLGSGQSFVIAGLLQDQTTLTGNSVPGLGDVPVLGALFRSDSFQRNESELVIVVTPYIVKPVNDPNALHLPTDGWRPPNDIERILLLRQSALGTWAPQRRMPADAGFMVE